MKKRPTLTEKIIRGLATINSFTEADINANSYVDQMGEEYQGKQDEAEHANMYLYNLIQWYEANEATRKFRLYKRKRAAAQKNGEIIVDIYYYIYSH